MINVIEAEDRLLFTNLGSFIPDSIKSVLSTDAPEERYRNKFLVGAMVELYMVDTIGSGIKRMYSCLFQPVSDLCISILSDRNEWYLESKAHSDNLDPLNYAVVSYLFAAAIRTIQVKKKANKKYYSSCLIHCEISKKNHAWSVCTT